MTESTLSRSNEFIRIAYQQQYILMKAREFAIRTQFVAEPTLPYVRQEARDLIAEIDTYIFPIGAHI